MEPWHNEIVELHEFFEVYFLGTAPQDDVQRVDEVLASDFTMVGPTGVESNRSETIEAIRGGHGHSSELAITITDARLLFDDGQSMTCRYVENHRLHDRSNHRLTTVVFSSDPSMPNGLRWRTVHETWIPDGS